MAFVAEAIEGGAAEGLASDAVSALTNLGFKKADAMKRVTAAAARLPKGSYNVGDLIKESLKYEENITKAPALQEPAAVRRPAIRPELQTLVESETATGKKSTNFFDMLVRNNTNFPDPAASATSAPQPSPQIAAKADELAKAQKEDSAQFKEINTGIKEIRDYIKEQTALFKQQMARDEQNESDSERVHNEDFLNQKKPEDYHKDGPNMIEKIAETGIIGATVGGLVTWLAANLGPAIADIHDWIKKDPDAAKDTVKDYSDAITGAKTGLTVARQMPGVAERIKAGSPHLVEDTSRLSVSSSSESFAKSGVAATLEKQIATSGLAGNKETIFKILTKLNYLKGLGIPVIGAAVTVVFDQIVSMVMTGHLTSFEEFKRDCIGALGQVVGAEFLAALFGALGSVIPGLGTVAGIMAGGIIGAFAGQYIAEKLFDWLAGDEEALGKLSKEYLQKEIAEARQQQSSATTQRAKALLQSKINGYQKQLDGLDEPSTKVGSENVMGSSRAAGNLSGAQIKQAQSDVEFLMSLGWSKDQAEGAIANEMRESSGDEKRSVIDSDGKEHYGLFQWSPDRQAAFKAWSGSDIKGSSRKEQLKFMDYELKHGEKTAGDRLSQISNRDSYAAGFSSLYERPADKVGEAQIRMKLADQIDQGLKLADAAKKPEPPAANGPPVVIAANGGGGKTPAPVQPESMGNVPTPNADRSAFDVASYWGNAYIMY